MIGAMSYVKEYAQANVEFTSSGLLCSTDQYTETSLNWALTQLMANEFLTRIGRGLYTINTKQNFTYAQDEDTVGLYQKISSRYPLAPLCIYKGEILGPIQHHLSYNAITYVETDRSMTETLFHWLRDEGRRVYHKPDKAFMYEYVDIASPAIIVKPLITGSPTIEVQGTVGPSLEKLLVDVRADADFDYLGGQESFAMLENAIDLYALNRSKLLRYAGRRGLREEFENDLKLLNDDK